MTNTIAVSANDVSQYGCPYCGYRSGFTYVSSNGTSVIICGECEGHYALLAEGLKRSGIGFDGFFPELARHPRFGIPKHGNPDYNPGQGGEYFNSRGVGLDMTPGCFICGGQEGMYHNIAAFVTTKESGERVVGMFRFGAYLDYRPHEPDRVQVKIGACDSHLGHLQLLEQAVQRNGAVINPEIILWTITAAL